MRRLPLHSILLACAAWALTLSCPRAQDVKYNKFVKTFTDALRLDDERGMDRILRKLPVQALQHFSAVSWSYKDRQGDGDARMIEVLKSSWKRVYGTETLEKYERYISAATNRVRKSLIKYEADRNKVLRGFYAIKGDRRRDDFETYRTASMQLAEACERIGHALYAAQNWSLVSVILSDMPEKTMQDREDGVYAVQRFVDLRKSWDWTKDPDYQKNLQWMISERKAIAAAKADQAKRAEAGYDVNAKGADALVMPSAKEEIAELRYATQRKPPADMFAHGGSVPALWLGTEVTKGPAKMAWFRQHDLFLVRKAAFKFGVTTDGTKPDGGPNTQPIIASAKYKPTEFFTTRDRSERYAMWFYLGAQAEPLMGLNQNLEPQPDRAVVYYKSAASWTATINGEKVTFYDDNCDGKLFSPDPFGYGLKFATFGDPEKKVPAPALDSMRIGAKGKLVPWSSFAKIKGSWFHLRSKDGGRKIGARLLNPEYVKLGTIQLKWKGPRAAKPKFLVIRGMGDYASACFDIGTGKAVEVPAGKYVVLYGRITVGRGARIVEAQIFGGDLPPFEVAAGGKSSLTLGGPFRIDFKRGGKGDRVEIDALTLRILGTHGELYSRINGGTPTPEILVAKTDKGKGAKVMGSFVRMELEQVTNLANAHPDLGIEVGFYPVVKNDSKGATVFRATLPIKGGFVGLRQKRYKLFGRLVPIWK